MSRVLLLDSCTMCWYKQWGNCRHPEMNEKDTVCPKGKVCKGCPLTTEEELYEGMKTEKYYEDNSW